MPVFEVSLVVAEATVEPSGTAEVPEEPASGSTGGSVLGLMVVVVDVVEVVVVEVEVKVVVVVVADLAGGEPFFGKGSFFFKSVLVGILSPF